MHYSLLMNYRTCPRIEKNLLVVIAGGLGDFIRNTIDISENGLKLDPAEAVFTLGQQVRVTLGSIADETYVALAKVVRADDNTVAVQFEESLDSQVLSELAAA